MTTLRDRARVALSATEPGEDQAMRDLEVVLRRARRDRRRWLLAALVPAAAAAGLIVARLAGAPGPTARPPPPGGAGVHLYLRAVDEPEARAITLDLEPRGDLR